MLAPLAGRIYVAAPQQNANPLDSTTGMLILEELRRTIESAALGELSYDELDRRLNFKVYELAESVMHSADADIVNAVIERREQVVASPTPEQLADGWERPEAFMAWLREAWRDEQARLSRLPPRAV